MKKSSQHFQNSYSQHVLLHQSSVQGQKQAVKLSKFSICINRSQNQHCKLHEKRAGRLIKWQSRLLPESFSLPSVLLHELRASFYALPTPLHALSLAFYKLSVQFYVVRTAFYALFCKLPFLNSCAKSHRKQLFAAPGGMRRNVGEIFNLAGAIWLSLRTFIFQDHRVAKRDWKSRLRCARFATGRERVGAPATACHTLGATSRLRQLSFY